MMRWPLLIFIATNLFSQPISFTARVKLDLRCKADCAEIQSYLLRELRSLKDVAVVEENQEFELKIIAGQVENRASETIGYFEFGYALRLVPFDDDLRRGMKQRYTDAQWAEVSSIANSLGHTSSWFGGLGTDHKELASRVVAEFDTKTLEPFRKYWQKLNDESASAKPIPPRRRSARH